MNKLIANREDCSKCEFSYRRYDGGPFSLICGLWGEEILHYVEYDEWKLDPNRKPISAPAWCRLPVKVI